jgi:gamma-glutamyltranspeptidase / glutathione hydrolase
MKRLHGLCMLLMVGGLLAGLLAPERALANGKPTEFRHGVVVAVSPPGADVGLAILKQGGNAVDAAVATAFAMAVTYPAAGNIAGGGFMLVHPAPGKGEPVVFEYRETAPGAATRTMFKKGETRYSHRAVGVPGTVRGLALAHQKFGKLPWKSLILPAAKLADDGFTIDESLAKSLNGTLAKATEFAEFRRVFGKSGRGTWKAGDRLVQPDLGKTLRLIADEGPDAFYKGHIADVLVAEMKAGGGLITHADLAGYRAVERRPIHGTYRGYDVYAPPPPSSGGIGLVQMCNILEHFDLKKDGRWSPVTMHLMIESMRRAYCDRARYLGDPGFTKIPDHLTSKEYARRLAGQIDDKRATKSEILAPDVPVAAEGESTTHFSIIDKDGMAVANTYTLEQSYGSRVVVRGAGFLLNNEMGDFNWHPGHTDRNGAIGTEANQIAPGKRMLSSQTPTILAKGGKVFLITGSPGGRTIINTVLNIVVNVVDFEMDIEASVAAPRLHHQWLPDVVRFEGAAIHEETVRQLRTMGHRIEKTRQGDAHSIWVNPRTGGYIGAADRRINGKVAGY